MFTDLSCSLLPGLPIFLDEVSQSPVSRRRELVDQLDRASISVLLNTAEGILQAWDLLVETRSLDDSVLCAVVIR
jgi:hypothetical protein